MRVLLPESSHTNAEEKSILAAHVKPLWTTEWKAWDLLIYMKKSDRLKDLKNNEIQLVSLHLFSSAVILDEEHTDYFPNAPANAVPLFLQWHLAARRWNSWTNIRDLFLPERGEKQQSISIFIFSHSFYFPQVCILYTWLRLCLVKLWFFFFLLLHYEIDLWYKRPLALRDLFHMYDKLKNSCMFAFPYLWLYFFSNHKITLYTCTVWLYWKYVDIDRGVI